MLIFIYLLFVTYKLYNIQRYVVKLEISKNRRERIEKRKLDQELRKLKKSIDTLGEETKKLDLVNIRLSFDMDRLNGILSKTKPEGLLTDEDLATLITESPDVI